MLFGVLDTSTGAQFIGAAAAALEHTDSLCIDMAGVPSYDAMGLAAILNVRSMAEVAGKRVRLINPTGQVAHRLHRTGIYDQLT